MRKIPVEEKRVKIKVDFETAFALLWRMYVLMFGIGIILGLLMVIFDL